ncbi:DNA translocase FtsK [Rhodothermaceae bacterium RA]|nr:DNA translocase FtsK [Rhodothermaceae bacterium RA]
MATSRKKRRKPAKKTASAPLVPPQRKQEVLGLILMVLALLVSLAVVTYTPGDNGLARSLSVEEALHPGNNRAANALGLVGAALAYWLVPQFLGYTSLLLTGLLFAWGYVVFRQRTPVFLPLITTLLLVGAFVLAALFGWFGLTLEADLSRWSGLFGQGIAGWMLSLFGSIGSLILLLLMLAVTTLLVVDHDIQRSLDRLEDVAGAARAGLSSWWNDRKARHAERQAERRQRLEERRKAAEQARRDRERQARSPRPEPTERTRPAADAPTPATTATPPPRTQAPARPTPASLPPASKPAAPVRPTVNDLFREPPASPSPDAEPAAAVPAATEPPEGEPSMTVQQRVEEEKADVIERPAEVPPDEDLPYAFPSVDLLDEAEDGELDIDYQELEENKQILLDKLETYNIQITDINAIVGPTVTMYELTPAPGVKISRITALEDDLAMAMAARGIRMIAPIPGKSAIGVEIPNRHRELVRIRDMIGTARFRDAHMELPVVLGKTIEGEVFLRDLTKMPHLLIAGATGSGKSVGLNCLITGLLYACHPANLKFVMIDPKKIELQQYARIVDHFGAMPEAYDDPIITDVQLALGVLKSCEKEMEERYDLLAKAGVRGIKDYNKKLAEGKLADQGEDHRHLPYIVVIVDELADLMMTAGKDIEGPIARLAQMARAVGIHLVLATQRPSVDVITGLIKANFPARIAYQVATKVDSRTILDRNGAQGLVGNGDLLYMIGSQLIRLQGPFVSVEEVDRVTYAIAEQPGPGPYILPSIEEELGGGDASTADVEETDDLFEEAARIIVRHQQGSVSLLQRKMSVGYTRAARIVDQLEEAGIVGPFEGSKARKVLVADERELEELLHAGNAPT